MSVHAGQTQMSVHADTLEQAQPLGRWFFSSLVFHLCLAGGLAAFSRWEGRPHAVFGDIKGGGIGSVAVTAVSSIPLPQRSGPVNPVANDTESRVPEPPPKPKPKPAVKEPEPDAIPLPSRNAVKRPSEPASPPNKFREKQKDLPNQVYANSGQAVVSPQFSMPGAGGVSIGNNSPFGQEFGWYGTLVRDKVARNWRTTDIDPRLHSLPQAVATFTIARDGSVPAGSVRVVQRSGNEALDLSVQRAILDAAPFPPLPAGFSHSSADVEFTFELRR
jgi:periplasmic protein TonB